MAIPDPIESQIQSLLDIIEYLLIKLSVASVSDLNTILKESVREIVEIKNSLSKTQLYNEDIQNSDQEEINYQSDIPEITFDEYLIEKKPEDLILNNEESSVVCSDLEVPEFNTIGNKVETTEEDVKEPKIIPYSLIQNLAIKTEVPSACNICGKIYTSRKRMKGHMNRYHDDSVIQCTICSKELTGKKRMEDHMRVHSQKVECNICNNLYKEKYFPAHLRQCLKGPSEKKRQDYRRKNKYTCLKCDLKFTNKRNFYTHKKTHFVKCQDCDKSFRKQKTLERHIQKIHQVPQPVPEAKSIPVVKYHHCVQCQYKTHRKNNLKRHLITHTKPKVVQEKVCQLCGKQFKCHSNLKKHNQLNSCKSISYEDKTMIFTWTGN